MKMLIVGINRAFLTCLFLFMLSLTAQSQTYETGTPPPIAQKLVREGTLAVELLQALGIGTTEDEVEAETRLGSVGIIPRNGWIADYPVTPDIVSELEQSIRVAADAGKLPMGRKQALDIFDNVTNQLGITVKPATEKDSYKSGITTETSQDYPSPTVINNYYYTEGPPVVTYYAPPPNFYYLYAWVPYSFWSFGFWFPGFYILHDFHHVVYVGGSVTFVSNHFNDVRVNRVYRIDPVTRFRGRTYAGIGVTNRRNFISTGIPRGERRIFNAPRTHQAPTGRKTSPAVRSSRPPGSQRGGARVAPPSGSGTVKQPTGRTIMTTPGSESAPPARGRTVAPPASGRTVAPPAVIQPPRGGSAVPAPRGMSQPSGGGGSTGGGGERGMGGRQR